jgi:hypothetical protein
MKKITAVKKVTKKVAVKAVKPVAVVVKSVPIDVFIKYARHLGFCELYTSHRSAICNCGFQEIMDELNA